MERDGRVVLGAFAVNWAASVVASLVLLLVPNVAFVALIHVLLFAGMPIAGFVWFLRDSVGGGRAQWLVLVSVLFQVFLASLPWLVLFSPVVRTFV